MPFITNKTAKEFVDIYYEDYGEATWNSTVAQLLDFLHLERRGEVAPFEVGKTYRDYFTTDERARMKIAIKWMASPLLWEQLSRYFDE